ncbi:MAG: anthranilate phosphoribosyltransferase [Actinomycetes bacterium]
MPFDFPEQFPALLEELITGHSMLPDQSAALLTAIFEDQLSEVQVSGLLVALAAKEPNAAEMAGLVDAMLAASLPLEAPDDAIDVVGTGGDHSGSINVSTMTAIVVAGAGVTVVKHGNRASSSQVGTADVLERLGVVIDLGPEGVAACVKEAGMGFCLAPRFHSSMAAVGPVRRELKIRTVFNLLGPLANPGRVKRQLVGVADARAMQAMAEVLGMRGSLRASIVRGEDGLDELTLTGKSLVLDLVAGEAGAFTVTESLVDPTDLGLVTVPADALRGGDVEVNATAVRRVLEGKHGPHREVVLLNAAQALLVAGRVPDRQDGIEVASASIDSGRAGEVLEKLVTASKQAAV